MESTKRIKALIKEKALQESYRRTLYIMPFLVLVTTAHSLIIDFRIPEYKPFLPIRLGSAFAMLLLFAVALIGRKTYPFKLKNVILVAQQIIIALICVIMTLFYLRDGTDITIYVIGTFGLAVVILNNHIQRIIVFASNYAAIFTGVFLVVPNNVDRATILSNATLLAVVGYFISHTIYLYFFKKEEALKIISEQKKELKGMNNRLQKLDNVKNDFIANMTHDFRSPLSGIVMLTDLRLKKEDDEKYRKDFELILNASYRMKSSIDRLLDLSKMDSHIISLNPIEFPVNDFILSIIGFYQSMAASTGITIDFSSELPDDEMIVTDKEKLDQIISNILSNALKFVDSDHGKIEAVIRNEINGHSKQLLISIKDNGIGIPEGKIDKIFKRFEQIESSRKSGKTGTGIGLAFSSDLITLMEGSLTASSEGPGQGATFQIRIPYIKKSETVPERTDGKSCRKKEEIAVLTHELKRKTVRPELQVHLGKRNRNGEHKPGKAVFLIIDDDYELAKGIMAYLRKAGYSNFIITNSGKMGLDAFYTYSPDIVLSDYNIPDLSGNELHNAIASNPKHGKVPFIFVSALADQDIILQSKEAGAYAFLLKPVEEKELLLTVSFHLQKYFELLSVYDLATIDELTDIYNRRECIRILDRELADRNQPELTVIFFDIDHFKTINDTYGHKTGDDLLRKIGKILKEKLRKTDIAARYGGDEFLIILPDTNLESGVKTAEHLRRIFNESTLNSGGNEIRWTSSFGAASMGYHSMHICQKLNISSLEELYGKGPLSENQWQTLKKKKDRLAGILLELSDKALYAAKNRMCSQCGCPADKEDELCRQCRSTELTAGRNRVHFLPAEIKE